MATPGGSPREAARKYPADTSNAVSLDGDIAQSAGNNTATGRVKTWPLQAVQPQVTDTAMSRQDRRQLWIECEDRPRQAEKARVGNRSKIPTIIGARKG